MFLFLIFSVRTFGLSLISSMNILVQSHPLRIRGHEKEQFSITDTAKR